MLEKKEKKTHETSTNAHYTLTKQNPQTQTYIMHSPPRKLTDDYTGGNSFLDALPAFPSGKGAFADGTLPEGLGAGAGAGARGSQHLLTYSIHPKRQPGKQGQELLSFEESNCSQYASILTENNGHKISLKYSVLSQ